MARYDLHFQLLDPGVSDFSGQDPGGVSQRAGANLTFNMAHPIAIRGLQKLANRFLKIFLTPKGSNPIRREEGTGFPFLVGGNIDPKEDLAATLLLYIDDAVEQIKAVDGQSPWLDRDEKLRAVNLLRFNQPSPLAIEAWVGVVNMAGSELAVLIPYATE